MACSSKVPFIGRYTKAVDLRFGMLDCAMADARKGFPKTYRVVVTSCAKDYTHGPSLLGEAEMRNCVLFSRIDTRSLEALGSTIQ